MPLDFVGNHPGKNPCHLHKEEVFAVLLAAGRHGGFVVRTEVRSAHGNIDCAWYLPTKAVMSVAFEIDGRDVHSRSYRGTLVSNSAKFAALGSNTYKAQVLYSLKNDLTPKPCQAGNADVAAVAALLPGDVNVFLDEDLFGVAPRAIAIDHGIRVRQALRPNNHPELPPDERTRIEAALGLLPH